MSDISVVDAAAVLQSLVTQVRRDPHLLAAWVKGSQARGDADRHSDIDLHLLVSPDQAETFRKAVQGWLAELYPVVRFHRLHPDWYSAVFQVAPGTLIGLDLFLEPREAPGLTRGHERLLWDRTASLTIREDAPPELETLRRELDVAVRYFWTLFLHLPGIERGEVIPAVARLSHLTGQLVIVCGLGRGLQRRVGENRGNGLLNEDERRAIEAALALPTADAQALVRAHLTLAGLMQDRGRAAAETLGAPYPEELETAVLAHVNRELALQGLDS